MRIGNARIGRTAEHCLSLPPPHFCTNEDFSRIFSELQSSLVELCCLCVYVWICPSICPSIRRQITKIFSTALLNISSLPTWISIFSTLTFPDSDFLASCKARLWNYVVSLWFCPSVCLAVFPWTNDKIHPLLPSSYGIA